LREHRKNRLGLLMLIFWLIYALPFIHIPPYIWFDFNDRPMVLWGLAVNPYMVNERVIQLTAMIGAVGGLGFALGCALSNKVFQLDEGLRPDGSTRPINSMGVPIWLAWVGIGIVLTALSAPDATVFASAYTQSGSALNEANFSSSWMVSYIILSFAFCDAITEQATGIKRFKIMCMVISILLVIVWYQLLRGDRESIPWAFGLALVYYYWAAGITQQRGFKIPWLKTALFILALFVINIAVGLLRGTLTGISIWDVLTVIKELIETGAIGLEHVFAGTWSGVLLTPLSVAGDHIYGLLIFKWGSTYIDLILSIIPGFLADAIGYSRPIDGNQGPAFEIRYGIGGTHASVVPFMNFGMIGVFLITTLWSWPFVRFEKSAVRRLKVNKLSFLVTFTMAAPHWLWYGEKNVMNALLMWLVFSFLYKVSLGISRAPRSRMDSSIKSVSVNA